MFRSPLRLLLLTATTILGTVVLTTPARAAPYCGLTWGSLPESSATSGAGAVDDVRAGQHACFDRLVVDLTGAGTPAGHDVRYVTQVTEDGSGHAVPVRGGAALQIVVRAPAYDSNGNATYRPGNQQELVNLAGYRTFRQAAWAGSFEGQTTLGLGVRARLPFRVFTLPATRGQGPRLVIDVAHRW